ESDAERRLAAGDLRQKAAALLLGAEAQQQRAALAVAEPVGAEGRAGGEHLFHHHEAFEVTAFVAAVLFRPGHADPAPGGDGATEILVEAGPGVADRPAGPVPAGVAEKIPDPPAQWGQRLGDVQGFEGKG